MQQCLLSNPPLHYAPAMNQSANWTIKRIWLLSSNLSPAPPSLYIMDRPSNLSLQKYAQKKGRLVPWEWMPCPASLVFDDISPCHGPTDRPTRHFMPDSRSARTEMDKSGRQPQKYTKLYILTPIDIVGEDGNEKMTKRPTHMTFLLINIKGVRTKLCSKMKLQIWMRTRKGGEEE